MGECHCHNCILHGLLGVGKSSAQLKVTCPHSCYVLHNKSSAVSGSHLDKVEKWIFLKKILYKLLKLFENCKVKMCQKWKMDNVTDFKQEVYESFTIFVPQNEGLINQNLICKDFLIFIIILLLKKYYSFWPYWKIPTYRQLKAHSH